MDLQDLYPTPQLETVLGKTLGVLLFQESAMKVPRSTCQIFILIRSR